MNDIRAHSDAINFIDGKDGIDCPDRIGPGNQVTHQTLAGDLTIAQPWLSEGHLTIGVTSGASTPDKVVEDVIEKIFAIKQNID